MDDFLIKAFPYASFYLLAVLFILISWVLVPGAVKTFRIWGSTNKSFYLGCSVALLMSAIFLSTSLLLLFLKPIIQFVVK